MLDNLPANQLLPPLPKRSDLITFLIKINGQPIPDTIVVNSISVNFSTNRIPFALITIFDGEVATQSFEASDNDVFSPGQTIEIQAGYHRENKTIFKGLIVRHKLKIPQTGNSYIEIECKDEASKLTMERKNQYFFNQKDSEIIESILRQKVKHLWTAPR